MKVFTFFLSTAALGISGYFFFADLQFSTDSNYLIYMAMLLILMVIFSIGVILNMPSVKLRKERSIIYNSYSPQRIRNKQFDAQFGLS